MGARMGYYNRREQGVTFPELFLSDISDGMAQEHNSLPHQANLSSFGDKKLDCHLQGTIVHGQRFKIARTFTNVKHDRNLAIYTWLVELEIQYRKNGKLPPTIYHQVTEVSFLRHPCSWNESCVCFRLTVVRRITMKLYLRFVSGSFIVG